MEILEELQGSDWLQRMIHQRRFHLKSPGKFLALSIMEQQEFGAFLKQKDSGFWKLWAPPSGQGASGMMQLCH
jgi:hypothetical protein